MLNQAASVAIRLLLFRAGPQDFPYSAALTRVVVPLALLAAFLQYRLTLAPAPALVHAVANVAVLAAFTHLVLHMRNMANRTQQTLNSLYAIGTALTLLMLAPLSALAPHMIRIAANPELARTEPLPTWPAFAVIAVSLWHFLASASIYRHALDTRFGIGALVALAGALLTVTLTGAVSGILT
jgi:hypothetical protein